MSVRDVYTAPTTATIASYDSGQSYTFDFSFLENSSIEVYELIVVEGSTLRYLVPVQDYTLTPRNQGSRYPVKNGGTITFSRRHSANATDVSIERNTLIDQTADFPNVRVYDVRAIEVAWDKATLIAQELAARKCNADVGELTMTQEITITQYDDLKPSVIQFAFDKITAILLAIDQSADDCRATPELT